MQNRLHITIFQIKTKILLEIFYWQKLLLTFSLTSNLTLVNLNFFFYFKNLNLPFLKWFGKESLIKFRKHSHINLPYNLHKNLLISNKIDSSDRTYFKSYNLKFVAALLFLNTKLKISNPVQHRTSLTSLNFIQNLTTLNVDIFFKKWIDAKNFLINLFWFEKSFFFFSTPFFKQEVSAYNWYFSPLTLQYWKNYQLLFTKQIRFGIKMDYFYKKLRELDTSLTFISNPHFHNKTLFYLNKNYYFNVSLIDGLTDIWKINYPLYVMSVNNLNQFFFFRFINTCYRFAQNKRFDWYKLMWKNTSYLLKLL
jgi:hypothetical protein